MVCSSLVTCKQDEQDLCVYRRCVLCSQWCWQGIRVLWADMSAMLYNVWNREYNTWSLLVLRIFAKIKLPVCLAVGQNSGGDDLFRHMFRRISSPTFFYFILITSSLEWTTMNNNVWLYSHNLNKTNMAYMSDYELLMRALNGEIMGDRFVFHVLWIQQRYYTHHYPPSSAGTPGRAHR